MLSYDASTPVTVSQGGVSTVYNKWIVASVDVQTKSTGAVALTLSFALANLDTPSSPKIYPESIKTIGITDILTDPDLDDASLAFFEAVIGKALSQGIIS